MAAVPPAAGAAVGVPDDYATLYASRGEDLAGVYVPLFARYLNVAHVTPKLSGNSPCSPSSQTGTQD